MADSIEQFIQERVYLTGVSPATVCWYRSSFKAFANATESLESAKQRVVELRTRGLSPVSVNVHLRCINAYWRWQGKTWKIPRLKEEKTLIQTLSDIQVRTLINFKPKGLNMVRAHALTLTIIDTGLRASEALGLSPEDVDFDNLIMKIRGKGGKHRVVPFSVDLRKILWRFIPKGPSYKWIFGTKNNTKLTVRNIERDIKKLGEACGITGVRFSPHTLRHTFATSWLRRGGDIYMLSRCLGHSNLSTTQGYLRSLGIVDIARVHAQVSLLSR